jgi:hypothetical protein
MRILNHLSIRKRVVCRAETANEIKPDELLVGTGMDLTGFVVGCDADVDAVVASRTPEYQGEVC